MTKLSVNLNKVALLRNARGEGVPDVVRAAHSCIDAGADGITVHPRPDARHIHVSDVRALSKSVSVEFNVEGYPTPTFLELVAETAPTQATLVPDEPAALTSDHGWTLVDDGGDTQDMEMLRPVVASLKRAETRVSLFMDPDLDQIRAAARLGVDRVELYTKPFVDAYGGPDEATMLAAFHDSAVVAQELGLGVNAGHDLNLANLGLFLTIPGVLEVSIGHALVSDALHMGLKAAVDGSLWSAESLSRCDRDNATKLWVFPLAVTKGITKGITEANKRLNG